MNKPSIAIIYTTFLRDELMFQTVKSITDNLPENSILLIGDQNPKPKKYCSPFNPKVIAYQLLFNCGLSYSRNFLVEQAKKLGYDYCLITADSIQFTDKYNFQSIIDFMKQHDAGLVGFELKNRIYWNCDIKLENDKFLLDIPRKPMLVCIDDKSFYRPCDMVKNFFLAKTDTLLDIKWDNKLKLCEHIDFFYRYSKKYDVYFTNYISADYIKSSNSKYRKYRLEQVNEFRKKCCDKYGIKSLHNYTPALIRKFEEWKRKNG